jgi:hypothetical protein
MCHLILQGSSCGLISQEKADGGGSGGCWSQQQQLQRQVEQQLSCKQSRHMVRPLPSHHAQRRQFVQGRLQAKQVQLARRLLGRMQPLQEQHRMQALVLAMQRMPQLYAALLLQPVLGRQQSLQLWEVTQHRQQQP